MQPCCGGCGVRAQRSRDCMATLTSDTTGL